MPARSQPAEPSALSPPQVHGQRRLSTDWGLLMCYTEQVPNVGSSFLSQKLWLLSWFNFIAENIISGNKFVRPFGNPASEPSLSFVTGCKRMGNCYSPKKKILHQGAAGFTTHWLWEECSQSSLVCVSRNSIWRGSNRNKHTQTTKAVSGQSLISWKLIPGNLK